MPSHQLFVGRKKEKEKTTGLRQAERQRNSERQTREGEVKNALRSTEAVSRESSQVQAHCTLLLVTTFLDIQLFKESTA